MNLTDDWRHRAACRDAADPDEWFVEGGKGATVHALATCNRCPVQKRCAAFAVAAYIDHGYWGLSVLLRRRARRLRRRRASNG
ncbi:MAG: WhiB family transcriptional regulator [Stackebrandtia sp.]